MEMKLASLSLVNLKPGTKGIIDEIKKNGIDETDLMEMGLTAGTPIRLVKFAPLGDPLQVCVRGYHLSLRRSEAKSIVVRVNE